MDWTYESMKQALLLVENHGLALVLLLPLCVWLIRNASVRVAKLEAQAHNCEERYANITESMHTIQCDLARIQFILAIQHNSSRMFFDAYDRCKRLSINSYVDALYEKNLPRYQIAEPELLSGIDTSKHKLC